MKRDEILRRSGEIRRFIFDQIEKNLTGITGAIVDKFKISRQAATRYLTQMVEAGQLQAKGTTKDRSYLLKPIHKLRKEYNLSVSRDESQIWTDDFKDLCEGIKSNVLRIFEYGFTEMVNNAIDHSNGQMLTIVFQRTHKEIFAMVGDDGVGIFRKIKDSCNLTDERQAILELSKGKLTTDPARHTGEGIFFSSRAFNHFMIHSHGLSFSHLIESENYFLFDDKNEVKGTDVYMKIDVNSEKVLADVFGEFNDPENNYAFDKTVIPVRLTRQEGEDLISRSQAKRLMTRVENFKTVMLDFEDVKSVGPAFADEIFRVFKNEHPNVELIPIRATDEVKIMIQRAQAASEAQGNSELK